MGSCTRRHFLLSICFLQLLFVVERQVFDFLGYMWAPILVNFFQILFVIFGIFGAYQYRPRYLVAYTLWSLLWLGWNIFLICFYLNIGILNRDSDILNLGTGSVSWFEENGYGCRAIFSPNSTTLDPFRPPRPDRVEGCLLEYHIVEVAHSGLHAALAFLGIFGAICLGHTFLDEDDSFDFMGGDAKSPQHTAVHPMYVSYSSLPTTNSGNSTQLKQTASSAKLLLTAGDAGIGGGVGGDGGGGGQTHIKDQQPHPPQALTHPQPPNNSNNNNNNNNSFPPVGGPRGVRAGGGGGGVGGGGGGVFMAKLNGHGPPVPPPSIGGRTATTSNHSPSNTNTLLSSSSCSPSSTFTNIINNSSSSPQSVSHHPHHHGQLANVQASGHAPHLRNSSNSLNSGGSRVILLQHQDSSESSSSPPMVPTRGLSRNASFSKATGSMGIGAGAGGAPAALRKNGSSSSVSVLRYTDVTNGPPQQGQRADNVDDDDTFFIPRSASSYQPRSTHFGISNPFNALAGGDGRNRGYRAASIEDGRADGRRAAGLLSGSAHQLANGGGQSSVPMAQKRNSLVGLPGGASAANSGRGSPVSQGGPGASCTSPPVPPLPQHFQRSGEPQPNGGNNAYLTRSPNLSRITRRQLQHQQHGGSGHGGREGASLTGSNGSMANSVNNNHSSSFNSHHPHHHHHHNPNNNNGPGYFNRTGSSGRLTNTAHQCDQIREFHGSGKPVGFYAATPVVAPSTPPENNNYHHQHQQQQQQQQYQGALPGVGGMVMHRAKSQDRLAYRSRRPPPSAGRGYGGGAAGHHHQYHQQQRPRSFCSNNGAYPDYVILEHPGN